MLGALIPLRRIVFCHSVIFAFSRGGFEAALLEFQQQIENHVGVLLELPFEEEAPETVPAEILLGQGEP